MAHQVLSSLFGVPVTSTRGNAVAARRLPVAYTLMSALMTLFLFAPSTGVRAQSASPYVPSVVVSSITAVPVPTPLLPANQKNYGTSQGDPTPVYFPTSLSLDACGNIYTLDKGSDNNVAGTNGDTVTEIPANGSVATIVENIGGYENVPLGQDPTHQFILLGHQYQGGNSLGLIPLVNCIPNASNEKRVGGGSGSLFYYYNIISSGADFAGNYYIGTDQTCCISNNYYLIQEAGGNGNIILTNPNNPNFSTFYSYNDLTVDQNQNVYYIEPLFPGIVNELAYSGGSSGSFAKAPVQFGPTFKDPVGLTVDTTGNLFIADQGNTAIYEIPYESNGSGGGALNPADQFTISSGLSPNPNVSPAVSARGDIYYTSQGATSVSKLTLGGANFGSVALGQTAKILLNFQFNATVTPATVQLPTGVFGTKSGGNGFVQCTGGAQYEANPPAVTKGQTQTIFNYCQVIVTFTPTAVGRQSSSVVLADASGNSIATAYIEGVGQGPLLTLDPGTVQPTASGLKSPTGIAVDQLGNSYIADPVSNSVTEYPVGGGAGIPLALSVVTPACGTTAASSALALSGPTGVTVDGPGNVYIADTGNNRIIEVPFIKGALSASSATTIGSCTNGANTFNAPASIFVQSNGDLYVTDTGNNQILLFPRYATGYGPAVTLATGLDAPLAATVDASGSVYIANSGAGTILEIPIGGALETVDAGLLNPSGLATDASGALFVADQGNFRVLRIPSVNGVLSTNSPAEVALGVANPYGVTIDSSGNLYVTDSTNAAAYIVSRSSVTLSFGDLAVATTSDPLPLSVESAGNLPVIFNTPYFTATGNTGDFAMTSPTGECADGITLAQGLSCDLTATFTPTASGTRAETYAFSSNTGVTAQATLTGSGITLATTTAKLALTAPSTGSPFYGEPLVFSATITGSGTPSGSVLFVVDGVQAALQPVVSGVASLPLNSGLTGGVHSIVAIYKGDSANDGSSSAPLSITIARAPTTSVVTVNKVAYNNPYSLKHSNPGSCSIAETAVGQPLVHPTPFPAVLSDGVGFTGTVTSPGVGIPSGTLSFYVDGILLNSKPQTPNSLAPSVVPLAPTSAGFAGSTTSDADTLGDGDVIGENNVLIAPHAITVVYSGDQNYLPSTSVGVLMNVVDVSPTTPITLPHQPIGTPPTYCAASSPISVSEPSDPATYQVEMSSNTVTASANNPGTVQLTINSLGGYNGFVNVSCPDLPNYATCSINPGQALVQPSTPGTNSLPAVLTLTVTTNVQPYVPTAGQSRFLWLPALLLGIATLSSRRRFKQIRTTLTIFGLALLLVGGLTGLSGCGSGTANTATGTSSNVVTPAGSYPVHVVMLGSQVDNAYGVGNNLDFQPDLPYSIPMTLVVK